MMCWVSRFPACCSLTRSSVMSPRNSCRSLRQSCWRWTSRSRSPSWTLSPCAGRKLALGSYSLPDGSGAEAMRLSRVSWKRHSRRTLWRLTPHRGAKWRTGAWVLFCCAAYACIGRGCKAKAEAQSTVLRFDDVAYSSACCGSAETWRLTAGKLVTVDGSAIGCHGGTVGTGSRTWPSSPTSSSPTGLFQQQMGNGENGGGANSLDAFSLMQSGASSSRASTDRICGRYSIWVVVTGECGDMRYHMDQGLPFLSRFPGELPAAEAPRARKRLAAGPASSPKLAVSQSAVGRQSPRAKKRPASSPKLAVSQSAVRGAPTRPKRSKVRRPICGTEVSYTRRAQHIRDKHPGSVADQVRKYRRTR